MGRHLLIGLSLLLFVFASVTSVRGPVLLHSHDGFDVHSHYWDAQHNRWDRAHGKLADHRSNEHEGNSVAATHEQSLELVITSQPTRVDQTDASLRSLQELLLAAKLAPLELPLPTLTAGAAGQSTAAAEPPLGPVPIVTVRLLI